MTNEDGTPVEGVDNYLLDSTCGLSEEGVIAHHYVLKALVGEAYIKANEATAPAPDFVTTAITT